MNGIKSFHETIMKKELTLEELAKFNGVDPTLPIYVAVKGLIYDVSSSRESYTVRPFLSIITIF